MLADQATHLCTGEYNTPSDAPVNGCVYKQRKKPPSWLSIDLLAKSHSDPEYRHLRTAP
jgi:hypothetical protein